MRASTLTLEGCGKVPAAELRQRADGAVEFRYIVDGDNYPGFDGHWRVMSDSEKREHLAMGGRIAEWLRSLEDQG